jgi:hypothetical protein
MFSSVRFIWLTMFIKVDILTVTRVVTMIRPIKITCVGLLEFEVTAGLLELVMSLKLLTWVIRVIRFLSETRVTTVIWGY